MLSLGRTASSRQLIIHAGTHKTASSYVQSRIRNNRKLLRQLGVAVTYAKGAGNAHKPLAEALKRGAWDEWEVYLKRLPDDLPIHLLSAEQFTQPLSRPRLIEALMGLLEKYNFELKVVAFVRDQPDYHNSKYVHAIRRLYHDMSFEDSIDYALKKQMHIYDYSVIFNGLIESPGVDLAVLPYGSRFGDPFLRLLDVIGCDGDKSAGWLPANPDHRNIQPGRKGVWLSQQVFKKLAALGVERSSLRNISGSVRSIAIREGWADDRYYGFSPELEAEMREVFRVSNESFAQRVWGTSWEAILPPKPVEQRIYELPQQGPERDGMLSYIDEALHLLQAKPKAKV